VERAKDMYAPDDGKTQFGPVGGVFVMAMGLLVLGIPVAALSTPPAAAGTSSAARPSTQGPLW
jgi:hypothetical protein